MARRRYRRTVMIVAAMLALAAGERSRAETEISMIAQSDLRLLDPVFTTATISQNHGNMVYDTLFGVDDKGDPQPQMVQDWSASPDGLTWSFTLRPGLVWHDNTPVTARDVVPSLKRWGVRVVNGQVLMQAVDRLEVVDDRTFRMILKRRFNLLLETLADPGLPAFIMREQDALTDPFQQVKEIVGSGPFMWVADEFRPGDRAVYRRFPAYVPRAEKPEGTAGGKHALVDRVVWRYIPDSAVGVAALQKHEVDVFEQPPYDLLPQIEKIKSVKLEVMDPLGRQAMIRPNHLFPPFDNMKAREALMLVADQRDYLSAMVGDDPRWRRECHAPFVCGSASESRVGTEPYLKPDQARAKQLFAEAGYKGEKIVIMDPTDFPTIHGMTLVTAEALRQIGINVDLQAMDWSTLTARRVTKESPETNRAGWHIFQTTWPSISMANPLTNSAVATPCDGKNWFGWACDDELEKRRLAYLDAATPAERKQAIERLQERYFQSFPFVPVGQYLIPVAYHGNLGGFRHAPGILFWDVYKQ